MATVYVATDLRLDRRIALKVMPHALADDEEFASRFVREARAAARLTHPNVVAVYDQGDDDGVLFLAMEYVDGRRTLRDVIREHAPLPPARALAIMEDILRAMAAAHESGIIHRDIKPENVLVSPRGQVKVADFGLARAISSATNATATGGVLMGTVSYLPPELVTDGASDARSDVYSLGVLLFELLTGQKPHVGESPIQVAYKHVHEDVPAPSSLTPGIAPYVDALVARATARQRDLRPADAHVMLQQLRRVRHAVDHGVTDDAELTDDLTPTVAVSAALPTPLPTYASGSLAYAGGPSSGSWGGESRTMVVDARQARSETTVEEPASSSRPPEPPHGPPHGATARRPAGRGRRNGWVAFVVVLLLAASAAIAGWYYGAGRYQSTPDVTGMSQSAAAATLEQAGFSLDVVATEYSEGVPDGLLISTDPGPGDNILAGDAVQAVISAGPERHDVPTVSGMPETEAAEKIAGVHLSVGDVTRQWSDSVPAGVVISASPDPGTPLRRDAAVALIVSKGPEPVDVPSFVHKPASDALTTLRSLGFVPKVTQEYDDDIAAGDVISQSPSSGTSHRGDTISLVVSRGPHLVQVPDVDSSGIEAARQALEGAGFGVDVQENSPSFGLGFVVSQSPGGGEMAPYGSTVIVYVV